jgi:dihydroorotase
MRMIVRQQYRSEWQSSTGIIGSEKRGVLIDVGHGAGSFNFYIAEATIQQGLTFDTISSDVHVVAANTPSQPYLPWV